MCVCVSVEGGGRGGERGGGVFEGVLMGKALALLTEQPRLGEVCSASHTLF